jgi:hypothetical protein
MIATLFIILLGIIAPTFSAQSFTPHPSPQQSPSTPPLTKTPVPNTLSPTPLPTAPLTPTPITKPPLTRSFAPSAPLTPTPLPTAPLTPTPLPTAPLTPTPLPTPEQTQPTLQNKTLGSFVMSGTIHSLILAPTNKWIATGDWKLAVDAGKVKDFRSNMTWFNTNGTASHTHELSHFISKNKKVQLEPDQNLNLTGTMDVGTNGQVVWKKVHSSVSIDNQKTLAISLDDKQTDSHFAGQQIFGVVKSVTECSAKPGANMEVLPACDVS